MAYEKEIISFTCQDLPLFQFYSAHLHQFYLLALALCRFTCTHLQGLGLGLTPSMPTFHQAALIRSHCSWLLCFMAKVFSQGWQWGDRAALGAGLPISLRGKQDPAAEPTPVGWWLSIGWKSREPSVGLNQWKGAKDAVSLAIKEIFPPMIGPRVLYLRVLPLAWNNMLAVRVPCGEQTPT